MKELLLGVCALLMSASCLADPVPTAAAADFLKSLAPLSGRESLVEFEGNPKAPPEGSVKGVFTVTDATHFKITRMSKGADGAWTATATDEYEFQPGQRDTGSAYPAAFCGHLKRTRLKQPERPAIYFLSCALHLEPGDPELKLFVYRSPSGAIPGPDERKTAASYLYWQNNRIYLNIQEENAKDPEMKATQSFKR